MIFIEVGKSGLFCLALYPTSADASLSCTCMEQWHHQQGRGILLSGELWEEQGHPESSGSVHFCPCVRAVPLRRAKEPDSLSFSVILGCQRGGSDDLR